MFKILKKTKYKKNFFSGLDIVDRDTPIPVCGQCSINNILSIFNYCLSHYWYRLFNSLVSCVKLFSLLLFSVVGLFLSYFYVCTYCFLLLLFSSLIILLLHMHIICHFNFSQSFCLYILFFLYTGYTIFIILNTCSCFSLVRETKIQSSINLSRPI